MSENGELLHYHHTSLQNFESAAIDRALLSYDKQKEKDKAPKSSGGRPDVVQMTRDKFDIKGLLRERGLIDNSGLGSAGRGVVLVFDESIMDDSQYDCIDAYPNLPVIPFDKLKAVLEFDLNPGSYATIVVKKMFH